MITALSTARRCLWRTSGDLLGLWRPLSTSDHAKKSSVSPSFSFGARLEQLKASLSESRRELELKQTSRKIDELKASLESPEVWSDIPRATSLNQQLAALQQAVSEVESLSDRLSEVGELHDLALAEGELEVASECFESLVSISKQVEKLEETRLFSSPIDELGSYVQIVAGAGGTDSCDWVAMLYEMYRGWSERSQYQFVELDKSVDVDSGGGFRGITFQVLGLNAYGWLKAEAGVHRLVRISPYDPQQKRHTSFAQVVVYPDFQQSEIRGPKELEIKQSDLRVETKRAGGPGGQHVNKTDSAIRVTHIPSGIVVSCQSQRSQHENRAIAMEMLRSRLWQIEKERQKQLKRDSMIGGSTDPSWGHQIRSVVLQPYSLVKDHRTSWETGQTEAFLSGDFLSDAMKTTLLHFKRLEEQQTGNSLAE